MDQICNITLCRRFEEEKSMKSFVVFSFIRSKLTLNTFVHILKWKRIRASLMMKPEETAVVQNGKFLGDKVFAIEPPSFLPVLSAGTSFLPSCFPPLFNSFASAVIFTWNPLLSQSLGELTRNKCRSCQWLVQIKGSITHFFFLKH